MTRLQTWLRGALAIAALGLLTGAGEPVLVPEVSQDQINIQYGFTGAELLLFGAIDDPAPSAVARRSDIVVVLKGPSQSIVVREKQRVLGIWVNADSAEYRSAPGYFAVASSRPVKDIVDDKTAAIYELSLDYLQLSPVGNVDPDMQRRFAAGLVDLNSRNLLYLDKPGSVTISRNVLYQARLSIPSSVPEGNYTAETFLVRDGKVLAAAARDIRIRKQGFERFVAVFAEYQSFWYGLLAVAVSVFLGWAAGAISRRI